MLDAKWQEKKRVRITIIDSGIDISKSDLTDYVIESTGFEINHNGYIEENKNMPVRHEHGTLVSMIIKHICRNIEIISINILDDMLNSDGRVLITAMEKALDYKPDIMHLSLGTTKPKYRFALGKLVKKAHKQNCLLVSSANNSNIKSYPSHMKDVLGVKSSSKTDRWEIFYRDGFFFAPPHSNGIEGVELLKNSQMRGSSLASAYITGYIAKAYTGL